MGLAVADQPLADPGLRFFHTGPLGSRSTAPPLHRSTAPPLHHCFRFAPATRYACSIAPPLHRSTPAPLPLPTSRTGTPGQRCDFSNSPSRLYGETGGGLDRARFKGGRFSDPSLPRFASGWASPLIPRHSCPAPVRPSFTPDGPPAMPRSPAGDRDLVRHARCASAVPRDRSCGKLKDQRRRAAADHPARS